jgi:hypothetical protein
MKSPRLFIVSLIALALVFAAPAAVGQGKTKVFKVSGFVGKSTSEAAPGVAVVLLDKDSGEVVGSDQTNFFGKYTIKNVPLGVYVLQVEKVQRTLAVKGKNVRLDIDLSAEGGMMDYMKTGINEMNAKAKGGGPGGSPGPSDPQMTQAIAGEYYSYAGSTEKKIMFCPEGTFFDSSESSYSGAGTDSLGNQTMAWGNASQNQGSGQWAIQGSAQSGTITLVYKSGKRVQVKYQAGPEKGCYSFDGTTFCYSGPARCR